MTEFDKECHCDSICFALRASFSNQKSVKDFFGSIDKDEAAQMEAALAECRKVDEISVEKM